MRYQLSKLCLLLALSPAYAGAATYYETLQDLTEPAPSGAPCTTGPTCPLSEYTSRKARVVVCAQPGETLSGSGTIRLYVWVPGFEGVGVWSTNRLYDLVIPGSQAGERCINFESISGVDKGYLVPVATNITVSGGTKVIVRLDFGYTN